MQTFSESEFVSLRLTQGTALGKWAGHTTFLGHSIPCVVLLSGLKFRKCSPHVFPSNFFPNTPQGTVPTGVLSLLGNVQPEAGVSWTD